MTESADAERTYRDRRRRRRLIWLGAAAVAVLLVVVTARRPDQDDPCDASAAPRAETALMPTGLSFAGIGTVTSVEKDDPNIVLQAVTTKPPDEAAVLIQDAVVASGYRPAGMDSEGGMEAEVFFTRGMYAAGQARVVQSVCNGRWDIELVLLDPDAVPS